MVGFCCSHPCSVIWMVQIQKIITLLKFGVHMQWVSGALPWVLLLTSDVHWQYLHPAAGRRALNTLTKSARFKAEGVTHLMQSKHGCNAECVGDCTRRAPNRCTMIT
jgi:hypothetical protein